VREGFSQLGAEGSWISWRVRIAKGGDFAAGREIDPDGSEFFQ